MNLALATVFFSFFSFFPKRRVLEESREDARISLQAKLRYLGTFSVKHLFRGEEGLQISDEKENA